MTSGETAPVSPPREPSRWELLRDATVLQAKLLIDGFRDMLLVPVSLVAALITLVRGTREGFDFYDVVLFGRKTEKWINLFGAADRIAHREDPSTLANESLDDIIARLETRLLQAQHPSSVFSPGASSCSLTKKNSHSWPFGSLTQTLSWRA